MYAVTCLEKHEKMTHFNFNLLMFGSIVLAAKRNESMFEFDWHSDCLCFFVCVCVFRDINIRKHSKPGSIPVVTEKEKHVVAVVE